MARISRLLAIKRRRCRQARRIWKGTGRKL